MTTTYSHLMQGKPRKAAQFDWDFLAVSSVENTTPGTREGIMNERIQFQGMLKKLNFIFPLPVKLTRNLTKTEFIARLHQFEKNCSDEPCGCIVVAVSSHGVIWKTEEHADDKDAETYEDFILTHPENDEFSSDFKEECVSIQEIVNIFKNTQKGIPKIFFIQACRSKLAEGDDPVSKSVNNIDQGVQLVITTEQGNVETVNSSATCTIPAIPPEHKIVYSPPCIDNSVIVFSTPISYISGFQTSLSGRGSHVWDVLIDRFNKTSKPVNLLYLLRETNKELTKDEDKVVDDIAYKPLLSVCHRLTKHIIFE